MAGRPPGGGARGACGAWLVGVVALALFLPVSSLFEDQVGVNDFLLQNVGTVKAAVFHPDTQKKRVFVVTDASVFAALDVKTGETIWRQLLPSEEDVSVVRLFGNQLATLSNNGGRLSVWDAKSGSLLWDRVSDVQGESSGGHDVLFVLDQDGDSIDDIAYLYGNQVWMLAGDDGKKLWQWTAQDNDIALSSLSAWSQDSVVVAGASPSGSAAIATTLSANTGAVVSGASPLSQPGGGGRAFCSSSVVVHGACLACVDDEKLSLFDLKSGSSATFEIRQLSSSPPSGSPRVSLHQGRSDKSLVILLEGEQAIIVHVTKQGGGWEATPRHTLTFTSGHALAASTDKNGNELWAHVRAVAGGDAHLAVDLLSTDSDKATSFKISAYVLKENGAPSGAFLNPYVRKDGSNGLRALVSTASGAVCMLQQEFVVWEIQGGLAHTVAASFVDLPVPPPAHNEMFDLDHSTTNPLVRFVTRCLADAQDIFGIALLLSKGQPAAGQGKQRLSWDTEGVSLQHDMIGDRFGFKKLAILLSKTGMIYGVHTRTGAVVWQVFLSDSSTPSIEVQRLFVTRPVGTVESIGNVEVLVVGKNVDTGTGVVWKINPLMGVVTGKQEYGAALVHASLLPIMTEDHTKMMMLVDSHLNVHVIPDTKEGHSLLLARHKSISFYIAQANGLQGYGLRASPRRSGKQDGQQDFTASESWAVYLPESENIVAMHHHSSDESVKAAGRVLGNRGVLLKYINVNLMAMATETPAGAGRNKEPSVRIYLIDTVVGAIVHTAVHKDAAGPVSIVQAENVVVYDLFNARKQRTELSVMELFENSKHEVRSAAQMMMFNETKMSSLQMEKPWVMGQSYMLATGVKTMAVTNTMHGITTRNFLLGFASDQIFSLDKRIVDPRRPTTKPTADDVEEGLMPYSPIVPLNPTQVLSYNQTVHNLRGISVSPARIESTCHMVAFGTDIFYSRVTPSKAYDCLGDDFNYISLALSVVGLACLTQFASWYLQRRELSQAWK